MFKRRTPKTYGQLAGDLIYPRGGWRRASTYVFHRLKRLPDQPHRIGRGVACGVFASFTPLFGLHFVLAATSSWLIGGNLLAALIGTFFGNALTLPLIAYTCISVGRMIVGPEGALSTKLILAEFSDAGVELWHNFRSIFNSDHANWDNLHRFTLEFFWPYLVGGIIVGLAVSVLCHYLTVPVIKAYHRRRTKVMAARIARVRASIKPDADSVGPREH